MNIYVKPFLLLLLSAAWSMSPGQSTQGITGKVDTGYTSYKAWLYDKQSHPGISIVQEFDYNDITTKKHIVYCTLSGRELLTDVFKPVSNNNHQTAIIMIHGGGWRTGNRTQHWPLAQNLAHLGYTCFTPEYRLSTEALFPAAVYDVKAMIRWVRANAATYHIDPDKIVIAGFSAGGELAAFMGTTGNMPLFEGDQCNSGISSKVNAVVDIDGTLSFVHPEGREGDDSKNISAGTYWFGYSKKQNPVLWEAASPLSYTDSTTPPTIFINSALPWMHAGRTDYIQTLDTYHIYSEVHNFENAPHSFCLYDRWFGQTVDFIHQFLQKIFTN